MPDQTPDPQPQPHDDTATRAGSTGRSDPSDAGSRGASPSAEGPRSSGRGLSWIIPAATFLVGLLLGGLVVAASTAGEDDDVAGPVPSATEPTGEPTTSPGSRPDATVTVPGSCLDVAEGTEDLLGLVQEAATAAQELDASELSSIVRQLQDSQASLEEQSSACQSSAGSTTTG